MHSHGLVISPSDESSRFFKLYSASPPHTLHSTRSSIGWRSHADCAALHSARSLADCLEELGHWRRLHTTAEGMRSDKILWFPKNALSECVVSDVVHAKQQKDCRKRLKTDNKSVAHNFTRLRYAGSCSSIRDRPESRHTNRWEFKGLENCNACNAPRWKHSIQRSGLFMLTARRRNFSFFTLLLSAHSTGCPGQFLHNRRARAPAVKLRTFYENSRQFNASTLRSLEAISVCGETIIIAHLHGNWGEMVRWRSCPEVVFFVMCAMVKPASHIHLS